MDVIVNRTRNRILVAAAAALCLLAAPVLSRPLIAQFDEAALEEQLEQLALLLGLGPIEPSDLERRVEEIGQLPLQHSVPIDFMSRDDLSAYIRGLFEEEYPVAYAEREERALRAFGFLTDGQDLRAIRQRVLDEAVAGFYDERPGVKKLFAIASDRKLTLKNQLVLSHEIRHAVQDQHIVIRDKLVVESDYDDRRLAVLCLIEGDASVLMEQYLAARVTKNRPELENMFRAFSLGLSGPEVAEMFAGPELASAPAVVQEQLVAPYFRGRNLATAIFERGGFELLNELLETPPRSTEQVLHPEKYLGANPDEPVEVSLPRAATRDADFEGRLGELLIRALLSDGSATALAETAAEGWGGDAYAVFPDGEQYALLWHSVWDSSDDAREFERALRQHMVGRFGADGFTLEIEGQEVRFRRTGVS